MPPLSKMPTISISKSDLAPFGAQWQKNGQNLSRTPPYSSSQLGELFDTAIGKALATMLGGVPILKPNSNALVPSEPLCVEVGEVRVIGGVRPQNFDVGFRPDGLRFAHDTKTLNDTESIMKNWQNMINDIATEATTVHTRFPYAVVAFLVVYPVPCVSQARLEATIETLERLARRSSVEDSLHLAEAISLVLWHPEDGTIDPSLPAAKSPLRLEKYSDTVEALYVNRYKGLPPHVE